MARPGRPRTPLEKKLLAEMSADEENLASIVGKKLQKSERAPFRLAFEAACVLLTLERGSKYQKALCEPLVSKVKEWARATGPRGEWPNDRTFLQAFIEENAPGWKWRDQIDDGSHERTNERIANETAGMERFSKAIRNRFATADVPYLGTLSRLRRVTPNDTTSWPTLRELKLATAIPERTLKKIIMGLRPKKREIVKLPLRHKFSRHGALPLRYGPRLIVGVLNEFVSRLPEFPIKDTEQKQLRKTALLVKRALAARSGCSC
jgi:hypothetical protein